jgi:hypothetical protein
MMTMQAGVPIAEAYSLTSLNPANHIVAIGDYNGDHQVDLLWRNLAQGGLSLFLHQGPRIIAARDLPGACGCWSVIGASSYDGIRLGIAGGPIPVSPAQGTLETEPAPGDPDAPVGGVATIVAPTPPNNPFVPDSGAPEDAVGEPIDTVVLPESATLEEVSTLVLERMVATQSTTIVLPLVVR